MARFTVSHHTGSKEGDHYDLMLEEGDVLKTWRIHNPVFHAPQEATQIKDHRKLYLDFEGEIAEHRGRVKVWDTGVYTVDEWGPDRIRVALMGRQLRLRVLLERGKEEAPRPAKPRSEDPPRKRPATPPGGVESGVRWTVVDAALEVRKSAAAFLRGEGLADAPTPELAELRTALAHEEQKIMAVVDQYARGGTVEWSLAEADAEVFKRVEKEKARWQHPWLAAAKEHAERLAELTSLLRRHRPG